MRLVMPLSCWILSVAFCCAAFNKQMVAAEPKTDGAAKLTSFVLRLPAASTPPAATGTVGAIGKKGDLRIAPLPSRSSSVRDSVMEGYYLGIVGGYSPSLVDARLLRVKVVDVTKTDLIHAQVTRGLNDKIKVGEPIVLIRPLEVTTIEMISIPDFVTIEDAMAAGKQLKSGDQSQITRSVANLQKIAKALFEFEDTFGHYPPAALVGPDGKPWHSWRVFLLPLLDQGALYQQYHFDEPWDGPNNKRLLDSIPPVYTDQPPGKATDHFTRYAAVTGKGMAFSSEGFPFDGGKKPRYPRESGTSMHNWLDGAANTLAVGTVPPEVKIPWTKPEDIVVGEKPVGLGKKGGFGAPYKTGKKNFALFTRLDGSVTGIFENIDPGVFHSMLTIGAREPLEWDKVKEAFIPQAEPVMNKGPVIQILEEDGQKKARLER